MLPDGTVFDNMTTLRKDNTGYDLKHLFIGGEGTLGVITECAILCPPATPNRNLAFVACKSFADVQQVLIHAKGELGDILNAVEFLDADSMHAVLQYHNCRRTKFPFQRDFPFYAMVETAS